MKRRPNEWGLRRSSCPEPTRCWSGSVGGRPSKDVPTEIAHILPDHDAHVRGQDFDAIGKAWQSLRARAAKEGRSVAVQPGTDALLKQTGGLRYPGPLPEPLAEGVRECSVLLRDLGERLDRCGTGIRREVRERDDALAGIERDWKSQRIKARMQSHDIAFLPGTEVLMARTRAVAEQYPGALQKAALENVKDCERVQHRWTRLVAVAGVLADGAQTAQPPGESTCRAMAEAEELIADDRLPYRALLEGVLLSVKSALVTLNERRAVGGPGAGPAEGVGRRWRQRQNGRAAIRSRSRGTVASWNGSRASGTTSPRTLRPCRNWRRGIAGFGRL